jgi:hypothetical protein
MVVLASTLKGFPLVKFSFGQQVDSYPSHNRLLLPRKQAFARRGYKCHSIGPKTGNNALGRLRAPEYVYDRFPTSRWSILVDRSFDPRKPRRRPRWTEPRHLGRGHVESKIGKYSLLLPFRGIHIRQESGRRGGGARSACRKGVIFPVVWRETSTDRFRCAFNRLNEVLTSFDEF